MASDLPMTPCRFYNLFGGFGRPCATGAPGAGFWVVAVVGLAVIGGCGTKSKSASGFDPGDGPALFGTQRSGSAEESGSAWTITLAGFSGLDQAQAAQQCANQARSLLPDLGAPVVVKKAAGTVVSIGQFDDPTSPAATGALKRARSAGVGGQQPFAGAFLAPPEQKTIVGSSPEFNLILAKEKAGEDARYTLEVAVYGPADPSQASSGEMQAVRQAAEEATARLRADGEQAYYYHGRSRSSVTIGLFGNSALTEAGDAQVSKLMKKYPNVLYNGQGTGRHVRGQAAPVLEKSRLVEIPKG